MNDPIYNTREEWLERAIFLMRPIFLNQSQPIPTAVKASCGFPRGKGKAIGQCWSDQNSEGHVFEVFISPTLVDTVEVTATLAHELAHAAVGVEVGHKKPFKKLVAAIGLEGKATSTSAGDAFKHTMGPILEELGIYPHARLNTETATGPKKQSTRLLKAECPLCGYTVRVTKKWVEDKGPPHCGDITHGRLAIDGYGDDEGEDQDPE